MKIGNNTNKAFKNSKSIKIDYQTTKNDQINTRAEKFFLEPKQLSEDSNEKKLEDKFAEPNKVMISTF